MKRPLLTLISLLLLVSSSFSIGKPYPEDQYEAFPVTVNTGAFEFGISYYRNNTVAFFRTDPSVTSINDRDLSQARISIYTATIKDGNLVDAKPCQELMDLGVGGSFAYDQNEDKIYFSKYNTRRGVYQLFESYYKDGQWTPAQPVKIQGMTPTRLNTSAIVNANWDYIQKGASIVQPSLGKNGSRIYFASNMRGGEGGTDIWYTDYDVTSDSWGSPDNLGSKLNTSGSEQYPSIVGDSVLYYVSGSGSGFSLRAARIKGNEVVATESMNKLFNDGSTNNYNLITDEKSIFFVSDRGDQRDDIFSLRKLIPPTTPHQIIFNEPAPLPDELEFKHVLVFFDFDKYTLSPQFLAEVDQLVDNMRQFPGQRFVIAGHTDARGSDAYNDRLSLRRAKAVQELLIKKGISRDDLVLKAYGKRKLLIENAQTEEEHAQNRRVEINFFNEEE